jgi:hypothetical protein
MPVSRDRYVLPSQGGNDGERIYRDQNVLYKDSLPGKLAGEPRELPALFLPQFMLTETQFAAIRVGALSCNNKTHFIYLSTASSKLLPKVVVGFCLAMQYVENDLIINTGRSTHYLLPQLRLEEISGIFERHCSATKYGAIKALTAYLQIKQPTLQDTTSTIRRILNELESF